MLCKRLKIDLSFTQPNGMNLLHSIIAKSYFFEQTSHLQHSLSMLITNGVDPCAVCDNFLTPTLVAFFEDKLDLWFTVLRQTGISVEAVAAHALGLLTESTRAGTILRLGSEPWDLRNVYDCCSVFWFSETKQLRAAMMDVLQGRGCWPRTLGPTFEDIKQLRAAFIEACRRQECYLNDLGDRNNMVTYEASSSVDFKPPTVYDPERAKQDLRRRTEAQKHPQ